MVHALEEIRRLLKPDGCLIDIHPTREAKFIKVHRGNDILFAESDPSYCGEDVKQAEEALTQVIQRGLFTMEHEGKFDLPVYGSSIAELQEFLAENEAYDDSPMNEEVEARMLELFTRVESVLKGAGAGSEVAYHERARITRLRPSA